MSPSSRTWFRQRTKDRCVVDHRAWNTAIDFMTILSPKLKLVRSNEYHERLQELFDRSTEAIKQFFDDKMKTFVVRCYVGVLRGA
jgi:hypothetical protein